MPSRNVAVLLVVAGALALAACQANGQKEVGGTVLGAASGGLLGSQVGSGRGQLVGTAVGTLLGAALGREIGTSLDNADRAMARWNEPNAAQSRRTEQEQVARWVVLDGAAAIATGRPSNKRSRCQRPLQRASAEFRNEIRTACRRCRRPTSGWIAIDGWVTRE